MHRFIHLIHFSKEDSHLHHACDVQVVVRDMNCYEAFVTCNKRREKSETSGGDRGEESNRGQSFDSSPVHYCQHHLFFAYCFHQSLSNLLLIYS